jgi:hypothetical protein
MRNTCNVFSANMSTTTTPTESTLGWKIRRWADQPNTDPHLGPKSLDCLVSADSIIATSGGKQPDLPDRHRGKTTLAPPDE